MIEGFRIEVDWIVIENPYSKSNFGLSIHFVMRIVIWIVNHKFLMVLDWIDSLKKWIEQYPAFSLIVCTLAYLTIFQHFRETRLFVAFSCNI
jgi:hypothetical protein